MNFWSARISPAPPTSQSSSVREPAASRLVYAAAGRPNDTAFMTKMPSTATPRTASSVVFRSLDGVAEVSDDMAVGRSLGRRRSAAGSVEGDDRAGGSAGFHPAVALVDLLEVDAR